MSKYEQCLRAIETERFKKFKLGLVDIAVILAIAKESDRLQQEKVEISDDRMLELVNEEMIFICTEKCKKLFKIFGEEEASNEKMYSFMMDFCAGMNKDLEFLYKETSRMIKLLKNVSMKKRKELIENFKKEIH